MSEMSLENLDRIKLIQLCKENGFPVDVCGACDGTGLTKNPRAEDRFVDGTPMPQVPCYACGGGGWVSPLAGMDLCLFTMLLGLVTKGVDTSEAFPGPRKEVSNEPK